MQLVQTKMMQVQPIYFIHDLIVSFIYPLSSQTNFTALIFLNLSCLFLPKSFQSLL